MPGNAPRSLEREAIPCGLAGAKACERHQISHSAQPGPNRHVSLAGNRPQSLQAVKCGAVLVSVAVQVCCAGFRTPGRRPYPLALTAGVLKAPRHEIAGGWGAYPASGTLKIERVARLVLTGVGRGISSVNSAQPLRAGIDLSKLR